MYHDLFWTDAVDFLERYKLLPPASQFRCSLSSNGWFIGPKGADRDHLLVPGISFNGIFSDPVLAAELRQNAVRTAGPRDWNLTL